MSNEQVKVSGGTSDDKNQELKEMISLFIERYGWEILRKFICQELGFKHTKTILVYEHPDGESRIHITEYQDEQSSEDDDGS